MPATVFPQVFFYEAQGGFEQRCARIVIFVCGTRRTQGISACSEGMATAQWSAFGYPSDIDPENDGVGTQDLARVGLVGIRRGYREKEPQHQGCVLPRGKGGQCME